LSYGKRKGQVEEEPSGKGKETGLACAYMGCNQDKQERAFQSEAKGLEKAETAHEVMMDVF
jgi:hypothetical protein